MVGIGNGEVELLQIGSLPGLRRFQLDAGLADSRAFFLVPPGRQIDAHAHRVEARRIGAIERRVRVGADAQCKVRIESLLCKSEALVGRFHLRRIAGDARIGLLRKRNEFRERLRGQVRGACGITHHERSLRGVADESVDLFRC